MQKLIPSRLEKRASLDSELINMVLDQALFCTISYVSEGLPYSIPTSFVRKNDRIYIHGSVGSHFLRKISDGSPVCISVMLVDALVVAKSAFSHSVNYRSVVIFSSAIHHQEYEDKYHFFKELTEKFVPDSWSYLRPMTSSEVNKTMLLSFDLSQASIKLRTGMPNDEPEDMELPIWSGIIPLSNQKMPPIPHPESEKIELPIHLKNLN